MGVIGCVAFVCVIVYLYAFTSLFRAGEEDGGFFEVADSSWLNNTNIQGKNGEEIREMAEEIILKFEEMPTGGIAMSSLESFPSDIGEQNDKFAQKKNNTTEGQRKHVADLPVYLQFQQNISAQLQSDLKSCSNASNPTLSENSDFSSYVLSDNKFLERFSRLKYLVNGHDEYTYNFQSNDPDFNIISQIDVPYQEYTVLMQKLYEYLLERQFDQEQEKKNRRKSARNTRAAFVTQQYVTFMIQNSNKYDLFKTEKGPQYRRSLLAQNLPRSEKPKGAHENGYDMFYKTVVQNQFIKYTKAKYHKTQYTIQNKTKTSEPVLQEYYHGFMSEARALYELMPQISKILDNQADQQWLNSLKEVIEASIGTSTGMLEQNQNGQAYWNEYQQLVKCLPFEQSCSLCKLHMDFDLQMANIRFAAKATDLSKLQAQIALRSLYLQAQTIQKHGEYLELESKTNHVKQFIKWISAIGLGGSFVLSMSIVSYYSKRQAAKSVSLEERIEQRKREIAEKKARKKAQGQEDPVKIMLERQKMKAAAQDVADESQAEAATATKNKEAQKQAEEEAALHSHQKVDQAFDKIYDKYLKPESPDDKKLIRSDALLNERTAKKYR